MDDIPTGFFKLPDLGYIHFEPELPYRYTTVGMLHSSKFIQILQALIEGSKPRIYEIMDGHKLEKELERFTSHELADFCRHILVINRDFIGWQVVDKYVSLLVKSVGNASWEKVDIIFLEKTQQLFSTLTKWELDDFHRSLMSQYLLETDYLTLDPEAVRERLQSDYQFWKFRDIWILFENMIEFRTRFRAKFSKYKTLLDHLILLFEQELQKTIDYPLKNALLITILSRGYVKLGYDKIEWLFDVASRSWISLENEVTPLELKSYRYLFAVIFSTIGLEYYKYNISFVYKRQLINRIIGTYFIFDDLSMEEWFENLIETDIDILLKEYLLGGFGSILNLLREFGLELAESREKERTLQRIETLASILVKSCKSALRDLTTQKEFNIDSINEIIRIRESNLEMRKASHGLISVLQYAYMVSNHGHQEGGNEKELELVSYALKLIQPSSIANLYQKYLMMINGWFPFSNYLTKMNYETKDSASIVNSTTFEEEIIIPASELMDYIKDIYRKEGELPITILELLFYYLMEWLQIFHDGHPLYQDVLLICSPIISIVQVQIIQAYYERNQHGLALVEYLNLQYIASVFRNDMDIVGKNDTTITTSYLANEYQSMIDNWNIQEMTDINAIVKSIKSIQLKFINQKSSSDGMIEDDVMVGFLEMTTVLEEIIESGIDGIKFFTLGEKFHSPITQGLHPYEKIGRNAEKPLPIPLFRNPNQYNAALSVIPFSAELSGKMVDLDLDSILKYFQIAGENYEN